MIYYGTLDDTVIESAVKYDIAILHPKSGELTREQVARIQAGGTLVLGYLSAGEDLRTAGMTAEEMPADARFTGDGTGPRIDPRDEGDETLDHVDVRGNPSPGGAGYASYYLDDNDRDGRPDRNPVFGCAYTNIGDPAWFDVLNDMTMDGADGVPGMREILTEEYGRGLGCNGLFLDTIDTCAPNCYTTDDNPSRTRFEWTAAGVKDFMARIKEIYPDKLICQNRGLFFYNPLLPHYQFTPRTSVDYLFFESYRLDSNPNQLYHANYFADNKHSMAPKIMAEAARPDGFTVLSLGYAEGPEEYHLKETLLGQSVDGLNVLLTDIREAETVGFSHYITDGGLTLPNDFVLTHRSEKANQPPIWSSVYHDSPTWPPHAPSPRVGITKAEVIEGSGVTVDWDVALHENGVNYTLYYCDRPFDFALDPDLQQAHRIPLEPGMGRDYGSGELEGSYPYSARITFPEGGRTYYMVIRACEAGNPHNEEKNTVFKTVELP